MPTTRVQRFKEYAGQCLSWPFGVWKNAKNIWALVSAAVIASFGLSAAKVITSAVAIGGLGLELVTYLLLVIFVAPYHLWWKERKRAEEAEDSLIPTIEVTPKIRKSENGETIACLHVQNTGSGYVENCVGELKGVYAQSDSGIRVLLEEESSPFLFRWADSHTNDPHNPKFDFPRSAFLEIARADCGWGKCRLRLLTFHPEKLVGMQRQSRDRALPEHTRYVFDIEVSSRNAGSVRGEYQLHVQFPVERGHATDLGGWTGAEPAELLMFAAISNFSVSKKVFANHPW